ncbi:MAG: glycosyltransferase family 2 protein [Lachnospiraceae bacterium]|nr:glycosyltransferase family 2 protein [Lachnospiraceae bacterium]
MSKTTVVIPNYNGIEYIEGCLRTMPEDVPVIVVDNGSTDGSAAIVQEKFPEVTLLRFAENRGFPAAVNAGIKAAGTPYVFLLNNDTTIRPDTITELEKVLDQDADVFSASAKMISMYHPDRMDGAGDRYTLLGWAYARGKDAPVSSYTKNCRVFSSCAGAALYRTEVLKEIGLFDENHFAYLEDLDVGYRAQIRGFHNVFAADAVVFHAGSASSGSRHNPFKVTLSSQNSVYVAYKNMPFLQLLLNLPFLLAGCLVKFAFFGLKGMGTHYAKGFCKGIRLCFSKEGRAHKVRFSAKNAMHYVRIEGLLIANLGRLFMGRK